jgi:hypothetical protein
MVSQHYGSIELGPCNSHFLLASICMYSRDSIKSIRDGCFQQASPVMSLPFVVELDRQSLIPVSHSQWGQCYSGNIFGTSVLPTIYYTK